MIMVGFGKYTIAPCNIEDLILYCTIAVCTLNDALLTQLRYDRFQYWVGDNYSKTSLRQITDRW